MASYNGNINLLALNGAKVFTNIDTNSPNRAFVCIPVDLNDIKIETSRASNDGKQIAKMRVNIWPLNEAYKNAARRSAQERGDINASVPTHEITMSFSPDYIKAVSKAYPSLVQQVKDANVANDPDIVNQNPEDENSHLFKAIRNRMNKRLAMLYQPQNATPSQPIYPQQFSQAAAPAAYVAPAEGDTVNSPFYCDPDSELPF